MSDTTPILEEMLRNAERLDFTTRRTGRIGSSHAGPICLANNPHQKSKRTALECYLEAVGARPETGEPSEWLLWGLLHEPTIAGEYSRRTGIPLKKGEPHLTHPERLWQACNIDRMSVSEQIIVELKNYRFADGWGPDGTDEVPMDVLFQVQHQMEVSGIRRADVACLIGGAELRIYSLPYSKALSADITRIEKDFFESFVATRTPPPPDWSHPATPTLVGQVWRPLEAKVAEADAETVAMVKRYIYLRECKKVAERDMAEAKARIEYAMGDAAILGFGGEPLATRKIVKRRAYAVEAGEYTQLHFSK